MRTCLCRDARIATSTPHRRFSKRVRVKLVRCDTQRVNRTATIVGCGVNGLTAGALLAQRGWVVNLYEATSTIGGAGRTVELGALGFVHDVGASVVPMAVLSPAFADLGINEKVEYLNPAVAVAHPRDDATAVGLAPDAGLVDLDDASWDRWLASSANHIDSTTRIAFSTPFPAIRDLPRAASFAFQAVRRADLRARRFDTDDAGLLFAGIAAHAVAPFTVRGVTGVGLALAAAARTVGWPVVSGGTQSVIDALEQIILSNGGTIHVDTLITSISDLTPSSAVLLATSGPAAARIAGKALFPSVSRRLAKLKRGPGVFKLDWALDGAIPWSDPICADAATVHLGGTVAEIEASELAMWNGRVSDRPFVILTQPSVVDPSRAPEGKHTAWAYAHVPNGWGRDVTEAIEGQVERFAPGFSKLILHRTVSSPGDLERSNANLVGGDLGMGQFSIGAVLRRPRLVRHPHRIGNRIYLASAAATPGPGFHGMPGYRAALTAIHDNRLSSG